MHGRLYISNIFELHEILNSDNQENPELIWNDEAREKVSEVVGNMTKVYVDL